MRDERGQALVELALVMSILLLILFVIMEFGRVGLAYLTVLHASREGARVAALGADDEEVIRTVQAAAAFLDVDGLRVQTTPSRSERLTGTPVRVTVEYDVDLFAPFMGALLGDPYTASGTTVMRVE